MKQANSIVMGLTAIAFLSVAACSRKVAAVSKPAEVTPVATVSSAKPTPTQSRAVASNTAKSTPAAPARAKTIPDAVRVDLNTRLARLVDALFDYDKSTIRADASTALKEDVDVIRQILADYPNQKLVIEGHADDRGSAEYNLALGDRRAHAVEEFLSSMGVPGPQLAVVSYGKERPVCTEENESCWQRNRRAHVTAAP